MIFNFSLIEKVLDVWWIACNWSQTKYPVRDIFTIDIANGNKLMITYTHLSSLFCSIIPCLIKTQIVSVHCSVEYDWPKIKSSLNWISFLFIIHHLLRGFWFCDIIVAWTDLVLSISESNSSILTHGVIDHCQLLVFCACIQRTVVGCLTSAFEINWEGTTLN